MLVSTVTICVADLLLVTIDDNGYFTTGKTDLVDLTPGVRVGYQMGISWSRRD
jgi:hypothetical protein